MKIKKFKNTQTENIKICIYGQSGVQKTRMSLNGLRDAVLLDIEHGLGSVENADGIDVISIDTAGEYKEALLWLYESREAEKYKTVVTDSWTQYGEKLFLSCAEIYPDKKDAMNLWGLFDTKSRENHDLMLSLNKNIVSIFLQETIVTEDGYRAKHPLYKAKKFKEMLPARYDFVLHNEKIDKINFKSEFNTGGDIVSKNRFLSKFQEYDHFGSDTDIKTVQNLLDKLQG